MPRRKFLPLWYNCCMQPKEKIIEAILTRGVEQITEKNHLFKALLSGKKLRVKHGIDPTGPKIHIGRASTLWKIRAFQDLGHTVVLIIGDYTAQIGDASDKLSKRPFLSQAQVKENMKHYTKQLGMVLDMKKVELHYNSKWFSKMKLREFDELAELFSVQQMIARRNFKERWEKEEEISIRELHYALYQGYDSVAIKADLEIGGADQLFNLFAGRKIQEHYGQKPQDILTTKMLLGLDGRKMSTSWGNVVDIANSPDEQFGKIMSMHDECIIDYFEIATDVPPLSVRDYKEELRKGVNPKIMKERLAFEIVKRYHGEKAAEQAHDRFDKLFSKKEIPGNIPRLKLQGKETGILDLLVKAGISSKSEARRLVSQNAVELNGILKNDPFETIRFRGGEMLKIGKHRFFKIETK